MTGKKKSTPTIYPLQFKPGRKEPDFWLEKQGKEINELKFNQTTLFLE